MRLPLRLLLSGALLAYLLGCSRPVVRELEHQTPDPKDKIVGIATKEGQEYWFKDDTGPWGPPARSTVTIRNDSIFAISDGSPVAVSFDDIRSIYIEGSEPDLTATGGVLGIIGLLIAFSIAWSDSWSSSGR